MGKGRSRQRGPAALQRPGKAWQPFPAGPQLFPGAENRMLKGLPGLCALGRHLQKPVPWMLNMDLKNKKRSPGSHVLRT